ncbi:MAG TPA: EamA family transporter [Gaiellaceae bacterium]|nr:EamA family transporter [Gaiellaceae bacterium]
MPEEALALALAAACLHAFWNLAIAGAPDAEAATAVALSLSVLAFAPVAAVRWDLGAAALPYAAASSALHLTYFALLAAAYRRADLSLVYPLARGLGPVLVLVASLSVLGADLSTNESLGVVSVTAGVLLVARLRLRADREGILLSVAVAACIAAYTLVDKEGMRHAAPVPYLEIALVAPAALYTAVIARKRGVRALREAVLPRVGAAGLAMFGAYALVLAALAIAPAAPVAAVRETSIVIATALAAVVLRERVGTVRLAGAALVAAGVVTLAVA